MSRTKEPLFIFYVQTTRCGPTRADSFAQPDFTTKRERLITSRLESSLKFRGGESAV